MSYTNEIYEFLYNKVLLNEEEIAIIKPELDKIVLFKQAENTISIIDKIIERGLYEEFKNIVEFHLNRKLNDPIEEDERDTAGVH